MRFPAHRVAGEDSLFLLFHRMLASFLFFPAFRNIIAFQGSFVLLLFLLSLFSGKSLYFKKIKSYFSSFFPCFLANHCISGKSCAFSLPFFPVFWQIMVFQGNHVLLFFLFSLFSDKSWCFREVKRRPSVLRNAGKLFFLLFTLCELFRRFGLREEALIS